MYEPIVKLFFTILVVSPSDISPSNIPYEVVQAQGFKGSSLQYFIKQWGLFNYPIVETKSFLPPIQNIFEGGTFLNLNKFEFLKNYWTIFLKAVHTKQLK